MSVTAEVRRAPAPEIVPADLRPFLQPVTDPDGRVVDWRLDPLALFGSADEANRGAAHRFRAWRGRYLTSWDLGDAGLVAGLVGWAATHLPAGTLRVLADVQLTGDRLDPGRAAALAADIDVVRARVASATHRGYGLLDVDRHGLVRTAAALGDDDVLAQTGDVTVLLRPGAGLVVRLPAADADGAGQTDDRSGDPGGDRSGAAVELHVTEWELSADGIRVHLAGAPARLLAGTSTAARVLQWLAPGSAHVRVKEIPLTSVWARSLVGLGEAARAAADAGAPLVIVAAGR